MIGEQTVARRIVMRHETWERLTHLANALREMRGVEVTPEDVANIALEAGLLALHRGLNRKGRTPSGRSQRSTRPRLKLSDADRAQLEAWLADKNSVRARQRAIALWLGRHRKRIRLEALRELAVAYDGYNVANFAQNMKKDGIFFTEVRDENNDREGWRLSREGNREARAIEALALAIA